MKKISLILLLVGNLISMQAQAFQSFVINAIRIEGLQRVSKGAVLNDMPVKVGETITSTEATETIRALYKTGFFKEVSLSREGNTLVVHVVERPTIRSLTLVGIKEKDKIKKMLKQAGIAEGQLYDPALLLQAQREMERYYFSKGKYGVKIEPKVETEGALVDVELCIYEGDVARIREIRIIGQCAFSEKVLLKQMRLSKTNLLSWWSKDDQYAKEKLNGDLEILRSYYMDRGFIHFQVDSAQVSLSPDKKHIYITIRVTEGDKYTFGTVDIEGECVVPRAALICLLKPLCKGTTFSRKALLEVKEALEDRLGQEGHSLAEVRPLHEIDESCKTVNIVFQIIPGKRVYVRRIKILGNMVTKDVVIRRELPQMEGAWISTPLVKEGRQNILRRGFSTNVEVDTERADAPDQVDVTYKLEESRLGQMSGGVGWSKSERFMFNFSLSQENFFGTGKAVSFNFDGSKAWKNYALGYLDPYFTVDGVGMGIDGYYNKANLSRYTDISNYSTDTLGGAVRWVFPIGKYEGFSTSVGYDDTRIGLRANAAQQSQSFVQQYGSQFKEYFIGLGWSYDHLDQRIFPKKGITQLVTLKAVIPGARQQYYRLTYDMDAYYPLTESERWIVRCTTNLGWGNGYGSTPVLPFYRNFFVGGTRFARGYGENSLGPKDSTGRAWGGNAFVAASAYLIFPNPIVPDTKSLRTALFLDAGQVYDTRNHIAKNSQPLIKGHVGMRYSVGVAVTWNSPLGAPISFSLAAPLNAKKGDRRQPFSFLMGTQF